MSRNRIAAILGLLLGVLQILSTLFFLYILLPTTSEFFSDFSYLATTQQPFYLLYFILILVVLMGIVNIYLGIRLSLTTAKKEKEKSFKLTVFFLVLSFIATKVLYSLATSRLSISIFEISSKF